MTFGEKVKSLREKQGWTQKELAERLHVSMRTVVSYERGQSYPKQRRMYTTMANLFSVDVNYLYTEREEESLLDEATPLTEQEDEMAHLIRQARAMFSGGMLSDEDKDAVMRALQEAYWDARKEREKVK